MEGKKGKFLPVILDSFPESFPPPVVSQKHPNKE